MGSRVVWSVSGLQQARRHSKRIRQPLPHLVESLSGHTMPTWPSRVVGESHFLPRAGTKLCESGAFADTRTHYPTITLIKKEKFGILKEKKTSLCVHA